MGIVAPGFPHGARYNENTSRHMNNNFYNFLSTPLFTCLKAGGVIVILGGLTNCSKPMVPVFEANKFRTTTGNIEKNDKDIEIITTKCEEDKEKIQEKLEKMRALLAGSE